MATGTQTRQSSTGQTVGFRTHDRAEVPPINRFRRWRHFDWDGVAAALDQGKAVTIPLDAHDVARASNFARQRLGRGTHTRYDADYDRLWVWKG